MPIIRGSRPPSPSCELRRTRGAAARPRERGSIRSQCHNLYKIRGRELRRRCVRVRRGRPSGSRRPPRRRAGSGPCGALALEAERLVERDRRLVPREDVELELAHPRLAAQATAWSSRARPTRAAGGSRRPSARGRRRGGWPGACRVRARAGATIARRVLGHEDGRVRVAADRLAGSAAPRRRCASRRRDSQPSLARRPPRRADERLRVARRRRADRRSRRRRALTAAAWVAGRGERCRPARRSTAATPPK